MGQPERLFAFRLSLALGCPHPDELLERLTLEQFYEWQRYFNLEPFGFPLHDMVQARLMWAPLKASADKSWTGTPNDFALRPQPPVERWVDPVEYLAGVFGVGPPPRPTE